MIEALRTSHVACAGLSLGLFIWRGLCMWQQKPVKALLWRRIVPDSIDTALLGSGIMLMVMLEQYPFVESWITVKLALLLTYIGFGFVALHFGRTLMIRRVSLLLALSAFAGILLTVSFRGSWFI